MIPGTLLALAALLDLSLAAVKLTSPTAGQAISGTTFTVEWEDDGETPALADLKTFQLQLCAGGSGTSDWIPIYTFTDQGDPTDGSYAADIPDPTVGGNTKNAYFLKMMSTAATGNVVNYSPRFTLSGMTGQFSDTVVKGLSTVSGTSGPADQNNIASPQNAAAGAGENSAVDAGVFGTPYTMQTGATRYAPMPPIAPTKITKKGGYSAQYPTSAYTPWLSNSGPPNAQTTQTNPITFSVISMEATIAAQPNPQDADLQKFLNRWKD